jgi:hypothetical protein
MSHTIYGTPYQSGTVEVTTTHDSDDDLVIVATFGNVFSENVVPLSRKAARELRAQLDAALHTRPRPEMENFLVTERGYDRWVVESLTDDELADDFEAEGGE